MAGLACQVGPRAAASSPGCGGALDPRTAVGRLEVELLRAGHQVEFEAMADAITSEAAILVEGATKLFLDGAVAAFRHLSLRVLPNEVLCVVGPSGCGKTTLLRCIAGLIELSAGELLVHGKRVTGPPERLAMVFQQFGLLPWKTVFDNAGFGLAMTGMPAAMIRERVEHYLTLVGLSGFERHYPYQLSGGMQQRVGLVRALAVNPSILLMDEPFAALDAQTREDLQSEVSELMERPEERKTVIFVTHSIDEAILLGDRVAVMTAHPGRLAMLVHIPFGRPRDLEAIRADQRFHELRAGLRRSLGARVAARASRVAESP